MHQYDHTLADIFLDAVPPESLLSIPLMNRDCCVKQMISEFLKNYVARREDKNTRSISFHFSGQYFGAGKTSLGMLLFSTMRQNQQWQKEVLRRFQKDMSQELKALLTSQTVRLAQLKRYISFKPYTPIIQVIQEALKVQLPNLSSNCWLISALQEYMTNSKIQGLFLVLDEWNDEELVISDPAKCDEALNVLREVRDCIAFVSSELAKLGFHINVYFCGRSCLFTRVRQ